jgi:hypothetical protein
MSAATNKVNKQDVTDILDLYTALPTRSIEGISRVLNGQIDTPLSSIYSNVCIHLNSKQLTLGAYREIYVRLCNAFGEEPTRLIHQVIEAMKLEKKHMLDVLKKGKHQDNLSWQDYVCIIVVGANPLYPVQEHEVEAILELYRALPNRAADGIARVLSGQTNTPLSSIYIAVLGHITFKQSNLIKYRDIYGRLSNSLEENILKIIRSIMIDKNTHRTVEQKGLPSQFLLRSSELSSSDKLDSHNHFMACDSEIKATLHDENKNTLLINPPKDFDRFLKTVDGKYHISQKEQDRLNRIYTLLSKYHAKSVTGALSGATKNKDLPIWSDLETAIDQIKEETVQEGSDTTLINLRYLRKLYWAITRTTGGGKLNTVTFPKNTGVLKTTTIRDQELLCRIYALLPEYHYKSVTGVLSGATKNQNLPIWSDIDEAINQIKQEMEKEGDLTSIDLNYFQKLYSDFFKVDESNNLIVNLSPENKGKTGKKTAMKKPKKKAKAFIKKK